MKTPTRIAAALVLALAGAGVNLAVTAAMVAL